MSSGSSVVASPAIFGSKKHRPRILCFGDSHTQGMLGICWVDILQERHPGFKFINCGVNGEVLESIRSRVEPALKAHQDVVGCVVLGGTNDCLAHLNPSTRNLVKFFNPSLKEIPPLEDYSKCLMRIFGTIYSHFPQARIAVLTPPLIGEQRDGPENLLVDQVCEMVLQTSAAYARRVQVFDLNLKMKRYMDEHHPDKAKPAFQLDFTAMFTSSGVAVVKGLVTSWDAIGEARGLSLHNDAVHLNNRGGKLLVDMLDHFVESIHEEIFMQRHALVFSPSPLVASGVEVKLKDEEEKDRKSIVVQA